MTRAAQYSLRVTRIWKRVQQSWTPTPLHKVAWSPLANLTFAKCQTLTPQSALFSHLWKHLETKFQIYKSLHLYQLTHVPAMRVKATVHYWHAFHVNLAISSIKCRKSQVHVKNVRSQKSATVLTRRHLGLSTGERLLSAPTTSNASIQTLA